MSSLLLAPPPNAPTILDLARQLLPFPLDQTQTDLLTTNSPYVLLNCHRQWGKTTLTALRALHQAISRPQQQIVVISPTLRQSRLLTHRCRDFARLLHQPTTTDGTNPLSLAFPNGSLILPLPAHPDHARGWSANLLIIDEAARVPDEVFSAVTPLIAATQGHLWLLSTPRGKRGFFYRESTARQSPTHPWFRLAAPAAGPNASGRLSADFLAAEQSRKTSLQFAEEYLCRFTTAERHVFSEDWIERAFVTSVSPFIEYSHQGYPHSYFYIGLDFGKEVDHSAITLIEYRVIPTGTLDAVTRQPLYRRELHVRLIERFPLHTPFLTVLARVARLAEHPAIKHHGTLVADATGLGDPLVELIYAQKLPINFMPIKITSGQNVTLSRYGRNVPKSVLVGRLAHLLEYGHLQIAADAPQSDLLSHELLHFERKLKPGGHATFVAGSTNHDDLVCALSLAGWWAWENRKSLLSGPPHKPLSFW